MEWSESSYSRDTAFRFARAGALVRVDCQSDACEVCKSRSLRAYAPADVPRLPIRGCMRATCRCQFVAVDPETELTVPQLVERGVYALKAGRTEIARQMLRRATVLDEMYGRAWLWLSGVVDDQEKMACLEKVLAIDPNNERAKSGLELLRRRLVPTPETVKLEAKAAPEPVVPTETAAPVMEQPTAAGAPGVSGEVLDLREERKVIIEQWSEFAAIALETDPQLLRMQGGAFLKKLEALDEGALEILAPARHLDELYVQWDESRSLSRALLQVFEAHRAKRDGSPDWRSMYEALHYLAQQLLAHRNALRARISTAGGRAED